jgi:hypothetical protein
LVVIKKQEEVSRLHPLGALFYPLKRPRACIAVAVVSGVLVVITG